MLLLVDVDAKTAHRSLYDPVPMVLPSVAEGSEEPVIVAPVRRIAAPTTAAVFAPVDARNDDIRVAIGDPYADALAESLLDTVYDSGGLTGRSGELDLADSAVTALFSAEPGFVLSTLEIRWTPAGEDERQIFVGRIVITPALMDVSAAAPIFLANIAGDILVDDDGHRLIA